MPKQAMILCGGSGTRLGVLTADTPKPLLEVGGRPFLDVLLAELGRHGFDDVVLLAAFEAAKIEAYIKDNPIARRFEMRLSLSVEPARAGTGGAVFHARQLANEEFLLLNGDSWLDCNLLAFGTASSKHDSDVVLAVRPVADASRYGVVEMEGARVTAFLERPRVAGPGLVNAGVYLVRKPLFDALEAKCSLERDVLPRLAARGRVAGVRREGYFIDIGLPETFHEALSAVPRQLSRRAVFLDRDGVLNHDHGYVATIPRFAWIDGARETVRALNDRGTLVFVVTNQAGVAHGLYGEDDIAALHRYLQQDLRAVGAHIDDFRYCPDHPEAKLDRYRRESDWRKPGPGMLRDLVATWGVDPAQCHMIGDRETDVAAGRAAGVVPHLFPGGNLAAFVRGLGLV